MSAVLVALFLWGRKSVPLKITIVRIQKVSGNKKNTPPLLSGNFVGFLQGFDEGTQSHDGRIPPCPGH